MVPCLLEFAVIYFPRKSVKGQALAAILANHPSLEIETEENMELEIMEQKRNLESSNLMVQA